MFPSCLIRSSLAVLALLCSTGLVAAQSYSAGTPVSRPGGYAGTELDNIYRESVGTGYSGSSLNQIALYNARAQVGNYGQQTVRPTSPRVGLNTGPLTGRKPFSGFTPAPTVSPYLNLFREDLDGNSDFNYQTLVRPIVQQQQFNQQVERQNLEIARRLQSLSAQSDFNPAGSKQQYPTGHQTTFMYYGHFYPSANVRPRPQR